MNYTATLAGFEASTGFRERPATTVRITDIRDGAGDPVCKAATFKLGKHPLLFDWGDRIAFTATFEGNHATGVMTHPRNFTASPARTK